VATDVATTATRPVRPHRVDDPGHWATIGGALGQRLAFATQHPPPYYALLGAACAGLTDPATVHRAAARFPTHARLDPDRAARPNQLRPLPTGRWLDSTTSRTTTGADHAPDDVMTTGDHALPPPDARGDGPRSTARRSTSSTTLPAGS